MNSNTMSDKTNKMSILLIKIGIDINNIIKEDRLIQHRVVNGLNFYFKPSQPNTAKWVRNFFGNLLDDVNGLKSSSVSAVLLVKRQFDDVQRIFAVTFGFGRNLLRSNVIEERFGLKTVLNSIDPDSLRSIDVSSLEAVPRNNRIQTTKLSGIPNFNIDEERDLLKAIAGSSSVDNFGKSISGTDSLCISEKIDVTEIQEFLDLVYAQYNGNQYRHRFPWVDHIASVKDTNLISVLDEKVKDKLNSADYTNVWMAIPEIIDWERIQNFKLKNNIDPVDDIYVATVMNNVFSGVIENVVKLKSAYVEALDAEGNTVSRWSYYKCIYGEVEHNDNLYIINNGKWFSVSKNYVDTIKKTYDDAASCQTHFMAYTQSGEGAYNEAVVASNPDEYFLMDKKCIVYGGSQSKIEVCDVYTKSGLFVHVKHYSGSATLSHLFNQGYVSANLLLEADFRTKVNEKLDDGWKLPEQIDPKDFEVVFGIISKTAIDGRPKIPFFSMVTFRHVYTSLKKLGFKVSLMHIEEPVENQE